MMQNKYIYFNELMNALYLLGYAIAPTKKVLHHSSFRARAGYGPEGRRRTSMVRPLPNLWPRRGKMRFGSAFPRQGLPAFR